MANNAAALDRGFAKAKSIIKARMEQSLIKEGTLLALKAHELYNSPKMAFTGNTWTGTAVGVYSNGILIWFITTKDIANMPPVVRHKLTKGETAFLKPDYMGRYRRYTGRKETDRGFSEPDAISFLNNNVPKSKYAITVVNGSEYAKYIEDMLHGDVITGTYHYAKGLRAIDVFKSE